MRRALVATAMGLCLLSGARPPAAAQEGDFCQAGPLVIPKLEPDERAAFQVFVREDPRNCKAQKHAAHALGLLLKLRALDQDRPSLRPEKFEQRRGEILGNLGKVLQGMSPSTRERFLDLFKGSLARSEALPPRPPGYRPFEAPPFEPMRPPPYQEGREPRPGEPPEAGPDRGFPAGGESREPQPDSRVPGIQDGPAQAPEGLRTGSVPKPPEDEASQTARKGRPSQRELMLAAQQAFERGDYPAVAKGAEQALEAEPGDPHIHAIRAVALGAMGEVPDALAEADAAHRLDPKDGQVLSAQAFAQNLALRHKEAKASAEKAIELRADSAWTWYQLAFAQASLEDKTGALLSLARAADKYPEGYLKKYREARKAGSAEDLRGLLKDPMAGVLMAEARREAARSGFGLLVLLTLLATPVVTLFLLRRRIAAWIVRLGMGAAPQPPAPTPVVGLTPPAPATPPPPGTIAPTAGRIPTGYRLVRQIGAGGMGAVFEAEDLSLERKVAIKRMRDEIKLNPGECERFLKEARTVAKLHHPSIVEIYAIVEFEGEILLVFEYLDGATLDALLRQRQRLTIPQVCGVLRQVCAALGFAHDRGVIHRDLKPSNIMVTREHMVKVMDFGVARLAKDALTRLSMTNTVVGTPPYMAPESETGTVRKESDLYSLGVCLYEMLTGARPFEGTGAGMLMNKLHMKYEPLASKAPGLPPALDAFMSRALNSDPEKRPRSAAEFLAEFEKSASGS